MVSVALGACALPRSGDRALEGFGQLRVINWSEYIDPELIEGVQLQLGLNIDYQELWEDKILIPLNKGSIHAKESKGDKQGN